MPDSLIASSPGRAHVSRSQPVLEAKMGKLARPEVNDRNFWQFEMDIAYQII
jgi:hypothetical protein